MVLRSLFRKKDAPVGADRRRAYRVHIEDLQVVVHGQAATFTFTAKDVSTLGIGLLTQAKAFVPGILIRLDLKRSDVLLATGLVAKVVRTQGGVVGCAFEDMTKAQETLLNTLILEEQKRQASCRKSDSTDCPALDGTPVVGSLTFVDPWTEAKKKKGFFRWKG